MQKLRQWQIWILIFAVAIDVFIFNQDSAARFIWQKYRNTNLALAFNKSDADLAMYIDNHRFRWISCAGNFVQKVL